MNYLLAVGEQTVQKGKKRKEDNMNYKSFTCGSTKQKRKNNFSLIELLVTVAVIAILAGMLLPALNKARDTAYSASCISNLKQLGTGMEMYVGDNDDWYPLQSYTNTDAENDYDRTVYWGGNLATGKYITASLVLCPGRKNEKSNYYREKLSSKRPLAQAMFWNGTDYGASTRVLPVREEFKYKKNKLKRPSTTIMLADSAILSSGIIRGSFRVSSPDNFNANGLAGCALWPAHRNKTQVNILYTDGHTGSSTARAPEEAGVAYLYQTKFKDETVYWSAPK